MGLWKKEPGGPLRYQGFNSDEVPLLDENGVPLLTLEGNTPAVIIFFSGTGLLIDKKGTVLTNRHLVRMWEVYEPVKALLEKGFEPAVEFLRIFFPGFTGFYKLEEVSVLEHNDLAILRTTQPPKGQTPLQLAQANHQIHVGEPVIIMSYPGTFDSILSRLSGTVSKGIIRQAGGDPVGLPENVGERGVDPATDHTWICVGRLQRGGDL